MPPDFENGRVVSAPGAQSSPNFSAGVAQLPEDTFSEQMGAAGAGANTLLLKDLIGGAVDLANQMPVILNAIDPFELAKRGLSTLMRVRQYHAGRKVSPAYEDTRPTATPLVENPIGGSEQMAQVLRKTGMGVGDISEVRESLRPFFVGGETVAGAALTAFPFFRAAGMRRPGVNPKLRNDPESGYVSKSGAFDPIINLASKRPVEAGSAELAAALLSGAGAGLAEQNYPGNQYARMVGEVATPLLPVSVAARYGPRAARATYERGAGYFNRDVRENQAARKLQTLVRDAEGPGAAASAAAEINLARQRGQEGTPSQVSGSITLTAIERELAKQSSKLGGEVQETTARALDQSRQAWNSLQQVGDIDSLAEGAMALAGSQVQFLKELYGKALGLQKRAVSTISGTRDRPDISNAAAKILRDTKKLAKTHADELYDKIPENVVVEPKGLAVKFEEITRDYPTIKTKNDKGQVVERLSQSLPTKYSDDIRRLSKRNKEGELVNTFTSGQLKNMRSGLLREARALEQVPRGEGLAEAAQLNQLANSIWNDLAFGPDGIKARAFWIQYSNNFKRGPGGKLFQRTQGELPPDEIALDSALSGAKTAYGIGFKRLRKAESIALPEELRAASGLSIRSGEPTELAQLQSEFLMKMASETIDFDGTVRLKSLQNFIRKNNEAINQLGITELGDLEKATKAAARMAGVFERRKLGSNIVSQLADNPKAKIEAALGATGLSSAKAFRQISKAVSQISDPRSRTAAMEGVRTYVIEQLFKKISTGDRMSGKALSDLLDSPMRLSVEGESAKTLRQILKETKIFTPEHDKGFDAIIDRLTKLENSMRSTGAFDDLMGQDDDVLDLGYRVFGTQMAQRSPISQNLGSQLVMAQYGSKMARKWFGSVPRMGVRNIMIEAVKDPAFMSKLLTRPVTLAEKKAKERFLNAYLLQSGVRMAVSGEKDDPVAPEELLPGRETAMPTTPLDLSIGPRPPQ